MFQKARLGAHSQIKLKQSQIQQCRTFGAWYWGSSHRPVAPQILGYFSGSSLSFTHSHLGSGSLCSMATAVLGSHSVVLAFLKREVLSCNWAVPSPIASPGQSSGTLTLPHGAKPHNSPWPLQPWSFYHSWGCAFISDFSWPLIVPWPLQPSKPVPTNLTHDLSLTHDQVMLPGWKTALATSRRQLLCASPKETLTRFSSTRLLSR